MKFGRVRFRIKKLVVTTGSLALDPTSKSLMKINLSRRVDSEPNVPETTHLSQISSDQGGMDTLVRMHSCENFSFERNPT